MAQRFGPDARLRNRAEFKAVETGGRRVSGRFLTLVGKPNGRPNDRLGIIASRRVGGAVAAEPREAPYAGGVQAAYSHRLNLEVLIWS